MRQSIWTLSRLMFIGFLLTASPAAAQNVPSYGCCGFKDWATYGANDPLRWHISAHFAGGVGMDLVARSPIFNEKIRRGPVWKRLAIVAVLGAAWQFNNKKEIPGYRWDYVGYDIGLNILAASITELMFPVKRKY